MRAANFLPALIAGALAGQALSQVPDARPALAVVVVTVDDARQGQIKHGRGTLAALGDERFGRFRLVDPTIPLNDFRDCEARSPEYGLARCARFYLHRALTPDAPAHVVVAFADRGQGGRSGREAGDMRALCLGRGAAPSDPEAQDIWLWTASARMHGVRDWQRDQDALAGCIEAALSETPAGARPAS
jgi:hypothetical protein